MCAATQDQERLARTVYNHVLKMRLALLGMGQLFSDAADQQKASAAADMAVCVMGEASKEAFNADTMAQV